MVAVNTETMTLKTFLQKVGFRVRVEGRGL
jgi:hypothetical protein